MLAPISARETQSRACICLCARCTAYTYCTRLVPMGLQRARGFTCRPSCAHTAQSCCLSLRRYVYQKAYVEFFCAPEKFEALKAAASDFPSLTYMAVNSKGDFASNQVSCLAPCLIDFKCAIRRSRNMCCCLPSWRSTARAISPPSMCLSCIVELLVLDVHTNALHDVQA